MIKFKYRGLKIRLIYCNYENFKWYVVKKVIHVILFINSNYENKSKILHKVIKV